MKISKNRVKKFVFIEQPSRLLFDWQDQVRSYWLQLMANDKVGVLMQ